MLGAEKKVGRTKLLGGQKCWEYKNIGSIIATYCGANVLCTHSELHIFYPSTWDVIFFYLCVLWHF